LDTPSGGLKTFNTNNDVVYGTISGGDKPEPEMALKSGKCLKENSALLVFLLKIE
jgi:hypothetical protein